MPPREPPVDVGHLLDQGHWTGYQKWLVALVALTIVFDGIDNQLLGIVIPTVMREWGVPRSDFALGGLAGLRRHDDGRRGRGAGRRSVRPADGAAGQHGRLRRDDAGGRRWPTAPTTLGVLRLLAGIGLGGAMPNAAALAAEYVPRQPAADRRDHRDRLRAARRHARRAARASARCRCVGWRTLFVLGGVVPIVAAVALRWVLPESPRFLARRPERWGELVTVMRRMGHPVAADSHFVDSSDRSVGTRVHRVAVRARVPPRHHRALGRVLLVPAGRLPGLQLADVAAHRRGLRPRHRQHRHHRVQPRRRRGRAAWRDGDRPLRLARRDADDDRRGDCRGRWA